MRATTFASCCVALAAADAGTTPCPATVATDAVTTALAGGTLYVSDGTDAEWTAVVDLGDAAAAAGCRPGFKPHMVLPSPDGKVVAVSYTGDTLVHLLDAETKEVVACLDAANPAPGVEAKTVHTGAWHGDGAFLLCDMTGSVNGVGGGAIHKYAIDRATNAATYEASVGLGGPAVQEARGTTATKPIALETNRGGEHAHLFFVTDAKGGGSIVDADAMAVASHVPVADTECPSGGLWVAAHPTDPALVVAQYGAQGVPEGEDATNDECLVVVDLAAGGVKSVYDLPSGADDAHGLQFCERSDDGKVFLVNTNRVSASLDVLDADTGEVVVSEVDLNALVRASSPASDEGGKDVLQPDVSYLGGPGGGTLYLAGRGPDPVSAVKPANFNPDAVAGLYAFELDGCGPETTAKFAFARPVDPSRPQKGNKADTHGVWGVGGEVWIIDQAATGAVKTAETFYKCAGDEIDATSEEGETSGGSASAVAAGGAAVVASVLALML